MMNSALLPPDLPTDRVVVRIGLISDTHMPQRWPTLPAAVATIFQGVDLILHAGDVGELWVLDQLSAIAPVVAVHGNDDSKDAQRELPYQQVITVAGQRILLWHSHFPDRVDEMYFRKNNDLLLDFERSVERAKRARAAVVIFGHWHIPLVYGDQGVMVINPGAIASGNPFLRQLRQTVALLYLRDDGVWFISHIDLAAPDQIYTPQIDWSAGFQAAFDQYNASILDADLAAHLRHLQAEITKFGWEPAAPPLLRVAHRCWAGEQPAITRTDWLTEIAADPDLSAERKARYAAILQSLQSSVISHQSSVISH